MEMEEVEACAMGQGGKAGEMKIRSRRGEEMGDGKGNKSRRIHHDHQAAGSSCKESEEETLEVDDDMNTMAMAESSENEKIVEQYDVDPYAEEELLGYRNFWEGVWSHRYGFFEDPTPVPSIRPPRAGGFKDSTLQIFSVRISEINEHEGLRWPLHVYGFVAARDSVDRKRNYLFNRPRDDCQILTQEDSFLQLTGPCRAIVYDDAVCFEFALNVKGTTEYDEKTLVKSTTEYEDKTLCFQHFLFKQTYSALFTPPVICRRQPSKLSTQEFTLALLLGTAEATIDSVKIVEGSWPDHLQGLVVCRTASIPKEDIILLDSRHVGRMPIYSDDDGVKIKLSRRAVSVELRWGKLFVAVAALGVGGDTRAVKKELQFEPMKTGRSFGTCDLGFCKVEIAVAWSLF